jgi:hypothetical protein
VNSLADRIITLATFAGIAGLLILHPKNADTLIKSISNATNGYVHTVQANGSK